MTYVAIRFLLCICYVDITISQFPNHLDFQKVNTIIINDEKYAILKPTLHLVTDYFKDFILKRRITNEKNKIFMDENGFRHFWRGMEIRNLRKADIDIERNITSNITKIATEISESTSIASTGNKGTEETTVTTVKKYPRRSTRRTTSNFYKPVLRQSRAGRVITTSFFCPFFGVITMTINTGEL